MDHNDQPEILQNLAIDGTLTPCSSANCRFEMTNPPTLDNTWYSFDGGNFWRTISLNTEGLLTKKAQIINKNGQILNLSNSIVKDSLAPVISNQIIDGINATGDLATQKTNLNFELSDAGVSTALAANLVNNQAGLEYDLSYDGISWSGFKAVQLGNNSLALEFTNKKIGDKLEVFIKLKDPTGNISSIQKISSNFTPKKPTLELQLNDGQELTTASKILYELNPKSSNIKSFRLGKTTTEVEASEWQEYISDTGIFDFTDGDRVLDGEYSLYAQVMDNFGQVSEIISDKIIIDH